MAKNRCITKNTSRKSTATKSTRHPLIPVEANKARPNDSRHIFGPSVDRCSRLIKDRATYLGPMGMGLGKGGIKRIEKAIKRVVPTRKQLEHHGLINDSNSLLMAPFARYVRQLISETSHGSGLRIQSRALSLLKEVSETRLVGIFEQCYMYTTHAGRVTLMPKDLELWNRIKSTTDRVIGTGGIAEQGSSPYKF